LVRAIPAAAALELDCHTRNVARPNQIAVAVLYGAIKLPTGRGLGKGSRQEPVGNRACIADQLQLMEKSPPICPVMWCTSLLAPSQVPVMR